MRKAAATGQEFEPVTFSGIPENTVSVIRDYAKSQKQRPRDIWGEIIAEFLSDLRTANPPTLEATAKGGTKTTCWPQSDLVTEMRLVCEQQRRTVSNFMFTALRRYAETHGLPLKF